MKISRVAVVLLAAAGPACILFGVDDLTGGGPTPDSGTSDDAIVDTSTIDAAITDSTSPIDAGIDSGPVFDCKSIDATFCDGFDRDAAITLGAPWTSISTRAGCTLGVNGELATAFDASTGLQNCYLVSNPIAAKNSQFTLDFDVTYATDTSNAAYILLAQVAVALPSPNDAGLEIETFQLLLNGSGSGRAGLSDYFPDAAQSPQPGNSFIGYTLGNATPFAHPSPACHITWHVDSFTPSASTTSNCDGVVSTTINSVGSKPVHGFLGTATLYFGFANPGVTAPAWSVDYDNMVFRAAP